MFESIINFFKNIGKSEKEQVKSKDAAKERLHLVLMQDRANVSADFLDLMKQEIIEVIKKYIDVDENAIDVRLTNKSNSDGTTGAPALYANIPIVSIKEEVKSGMAREGKNDSKETNNEETNESIASVKEIISEEKLENNEQPTEEVVEVEAQKQEQERTQNSEDLNNEYKKKENIEEKQNIQEGENKEINTNYNTTNYNKENEEQTTN